MSDKIQTNSVTYLMRNRKSGFSIHNVFLPIISWQRAVCQEAPCERADLRSMLRNLMWVRKAASKNGINHMTGGPHYFLLAIPFRRNVLTIHDLVLLHNYSGLKRLIFKWLWFELPIKCSKAVTCITETVRQELLTTLHVDARKVVTIHNPVSPLYQFSAYTFHSDCPRILHVGTAWNKNTVNVVKALKGIRCKLVIVGELTDEIVQALRETQTDYETLSNITNEALYEQYRQADIISFPSVFEGFGMPIIEGQATGRPVLTSNIAPMTEVAGDGACLVDPTDTESIRNGFLRIMDDESYRTALIEKGKANVKHYALDNIAAQYQKLYDRL